MRRLTEKELVWRINNKTIEKEHVKQLCEYLSMKDDTFLEKLAESVIQSFVEKEEYEKAFELKRMIEGKTEEQLLDEIERDIKNRKK